MMSSVCFFPWDIIYPKELESLCNIIFLLDVLFGFMIFSKEDTAFFPKWYT